MAPEFTVDPGRAGAHERPGAERSGTWIRLACCEATVHSVRVRSQRDGTITITAPGEPHADWVKRPEMIEPVILGWSDVGGTIILNCTVLPPAEADADWTLNVVSTQDFVQRRRHVRVRSDATVQLMDGNLDRVISGRVLDVSELGMKCEFYDFIPADVMNPFQWALHLGETTVVVLSKMRWSGRTGPLEFQAGFEFIDTYESLLTRLRSYVMMQLDNEGPITD